MKIRNMTLCALFAALLAVCAWLSLPVADIAFTMQTFGVFLTLGLLGGRRGTLAIFLYLLLGAAGLPVFAGFQGGIHTLLGITGGYIAGFLFSGLVYWLITGLMGCSSIIKLTAMVLGLLTCYLFGSAWFCLLYLQGGHPISIYLVFARCVAPYVIPDIIKLGLAWLFAGRLKRFVQLGT